MLVLLLASGGLAQSGVPAGSLLEAQATVRYLDSAGLPQSALSNVVLSMVREVWGVRLLPEAASAPQFTTVVGAEVGIPFTLVNVGNTAVSVALDARLVGAQGSNDGFATASLRAALDDNCNARREPHEALIPLDASSASIELLHRQQRCLLLLVELEEAGAFEIEVTAHLPGSVRLAPGSVRSVASHAALVVVSGGVLELRSQSSPSDLFAGTDPVRVTAELSNQSSAAACGVELQLAGALASDLQALLIALDIPLGMRLIEPLASDFSGVSVPLLYGLVDSGSALERRWLRASDAELLLEPPQRSALALLGDASQPCPLGPGSTVHAEALLELADTSAVAGSEFVGAFEARWAGSPEGAPLVERRSLRLRISDQRSVAITLPSGEGANFSAPYLELPQRIPERSLPLRAGGSFTLYERIEQRSNLAASYRISVTTTVGAFDPQSGRVTLDEGGLLEGLLERSGAPGEAYRVIGAGVVVINGASLELRPGDELIWSPTAGRWVREPTWVCEVRRSDGLTPLRVLPALAPEQSALVAVHCHIPVASVSPRTLTFSVEDTLDGRVSDQTQWRFDELLAGFAADVSVVAGAGQSWVAGSDGRLLLRLRHPLPDGAPDEYRISWRSEPAGFVPREVTFYKADCTAGTAQSVSEVRNTSGVLLPGTEVCLLAQIRLSVALDSDAEFQSRQPGVQRRLEFTATSLRDPAASASVTSAVQIAHRGGFEFSPPRSASVRTPGAALLSHTLINRGNTRAQVTLLPAIALPAGSGSVAYATSSEGPFEPSLRIDLEPLGRLDPNGVALDRAVIFVRFETSLGLAPGLRIDLPVRARLDYQGLGSGEANATLNASVNNSLDVVGGQLRVEMSVCTVLSVDGPCQRSADEVLPGELLRYTIDAINDGNRPLPQIVLSDPLPNATRFVAARAEASFPGTVLYAVDQQPFSDQPPTSVRSGQAVSVAVRTHSPAGGFGELDTVPPGGRVTLRLVVSVR